MSAKTKIMKTIIIISTSLMLSLTTALAQINEPTPPPPPPPGTSVSVHSDSKSSNSYSYSINTDDKNGGNVSISTSSTDDSYNFNLKYDGAKDAQIEELLYQELGTNNRSKKGSKTIWSTTSGGEEVYEIRFSKGSLRIALNKEIASETLTKKITEIGKQVRSMITGKSDKRREAQRLQREADRLRRDADRMRREADRLERQEARNTERIKREAERLARSANQADGYARKRGSVSTVVSSLLLSESTYFDGVNRGTNWVLPRFLPRLQKALLNDGLIRSKEEINFLKEGSSMYVNGVKISEDQKPKYLTLFNVVAIDSNFSFSFNQKRDHVVIVDEDPLIDTLVKKLIKEGYLPATNKKTILEVNGDSVIRNGESLTASDVKKINQILFDNKIIAAPGKTVSYKSKGNYTVGYVLDNGRTHLGTWVMND